MRRIGPYELVRELGRGGMGVVHEVRDPAGRRLALKLILEVSQGEALTRFRREAELMARVKHPNVVRVHALDVAPEGPFIVTELVDGRSLSQVAREGPLAPEQAAQLVRTLADAVEALHAHGILHRDLKPQNVIVRPDDTPVLLDFGLARDLVSKERLTVTGALMGTPVYMAPEQAEGLKSSTLGPTVDVYALGAILLETLSGLPPFDETQGAMVTIKRVIMDEPRWPSRTRPGIPHALEAICRLAMSKAPPERYATAAALKDDLDRFLRGEPPLALTRFPPPRTGVRLAIGVAAAALACALGTVGLVLYAVQPDPPPTPPPTPTTEAPAPAATVVKAPEVTTAPSRVVAPTSLEGAIVLEHEPGAAAVNGLFIDDSKVVTWGREDFSVRVWSLAGREASLLGETKLPDLVHEAALHGDALLVRTPTEVLRLDLATLKIVKRWTLPSEPPQQRYEHQRPIAVTGDLVFVPTFHAAHVLDARSLEPRDGPALAHPDSKESRFVSAAARGKWVVAGAGQPAMSGADKDPKTRDRYDDRDPSLDAGHGQVHLWDLTTGLRRSFTVGLSTTVTTVDLDAHDPPRVAFGTSGVVGLWNPETDENESLVGTAAVLPTTSETAELARYGAASHCGYVYGAAFSPDGRLCSTSCGYSLSDPWNEVRVWSPDGKHVGRLSKVLRCPRELAFSPDGTRVLVGTWTLHDGWKGAEVWEVKTLESALSRD